MHPPQPQARRSAQCYCLAFLLVRDFLRSSRVAPDIYSRSGMATYVFTAPGSDSAPRARDRRMRSRISDLVCLDRTPQFRPRIFRGLDGIHFHLRERPRGDLDHRQ